MSSGTTCHLGGMQPMRTHLMSHIVVDLRAAEVHYVFLPQNLACHPSSKRPHAETNPLVTTLVVYAVKLAIVTVVLLHDFENEDSAIIASLLISLLILFYGIISAQIASESGFVARWFLSLAKLGEPHKQATTAWNDEPSALTGESLELLTRKDIPYTLAGAAFNLILVTAATVKLLYLLRGLKR